MFRNTQTKLIVWIYMGRHRGAPATFHYGDPGRWTVLPVIFSPSFMMHFYDHYGGTPLLRSPAASGPRPRITYTLIIINTSRCITLESWSRTWTSSCSLNLSAQGQYCGSHRFWILFVKRNRRRKGWVLGTGRKSGRRRHSGYNKTNSFPGESFR